MYYEAILNTLPHLKWNGYISLFFDDENTILVEDAILDENAISILILAILLFWWWKYYSGRGRHPNLCNLLHLSDWVTEKHSKMHLHMMYKHIKIIQIMIW